MKRTTRDPTAAPPPADVDAEKAVASCLLVMPECSDEVLGLVAVDDFSDQVCRRVVATVRDLAGTNYDLPAIVGRLRNELDGDAISQIAELAQHPKAITAAAVHANRVRDIATRRRLWGIGADLQRSTHNGEATTDLIGRAAADLHVLAESGQKPRESQFRKITTRDLLEASPAPNYLVPGILVDGEPGQICGQFKTLKTTIAIDLGIALSIGGCFLGFFRVSRPVRVGMFSGESGRPTLAESVARIARSARVDPVESLENLVWSTDLPKLDQLPSVNALERFIRDEGLRVVFIDPLYRAFSAAGDDAPNVFKMGAHYGPIAEIGHRTGCTLILLHHASRGASRLRGFEPPELSDSAFAGTAEFVRQWLLLGRRSTYVPGTGRHELWMNVGGSAGHSGLFALTIDEGRQDDPSGRRWEVAVEHADEARQFEAERRQSALSERQAQRAAEKLDADERTLVNAMARHPDGETKGALRAETGFSGERMNVVMALLISKGHAVRCEVQKAGRKAPWEAFKLVDNEASK